MLSLYFHIPFCEKKCNYCSFQVCPKDLTKPELWEDILDTYVENLKEEIKFYGENLENGEQQEIFTIYFGGGTPGLLGPERIIAILEEAKKYFNLENLSELGIELNPYPIDDVYYFVDTINIYAKNFSKVRYSFGIQSLDNKILTKNQRQSSFTGVVDFLRGLRKYKRDNIFFNLDFIAFGEFNQDKNGDLALWSDAAWEFYNDLAESHFIDSFSLYTLELFAGSQTFHEKIGKEENLETQGKADLISDEFTLLKQVVEEEGYQRYELSNFALPGKSSIHNHVYWTMENYLGLGTSASGFVNNKLLDTLDDNKKDMLLKYWGVENNSTIYGIRRTNTLNLESYAIHNKRVAIHEILNERAYLIDEFFLAMRTSMGIRNLEKYKTILVSNYQKLLSSLEKEGFVYYDREGGRISLTDEGMNVYNTIITDLVEF